MPYKAAFMALLISPMIVPLIISGTAIFFFMAKVGLAATHTGIIIAHIILGTPFVVITVTATLTGFDHSVTRAAASLGSNPVHTFRKITLPLIMPGVISGALFAFVTSFDEVIVVLFLAGLENYNYSYSNVGWIKRTIKSNYISSCDMFDCDVDINSSKCRVT
jgi:putative spermidine/putrescine transport system permease protein